MKTTLLTRIVLLIFCFSLVTAFAKEKAPAPKSVNIVKDPDFYVQGEYVGSIQNGTSKEKTGVQVIALGAGQFRAVILKGGLPGGGWDGKTKTEINGKRTGKATVFGDRKTTGLIIRRNRMQEISKGKAIGTFRKVHRKSQTLGLKPVKGAIVIFNGTNTDKLKNGRMDKDKLLMQGTRSKQLFGDHIIHMEFRIPFMPRSRGQGRGNSGMYLQGRYEAQILDSFGLKGKNNECGGLYSVADPKTNMCFPPLSWQTYDAQLTTARFDANGKKTANARMTVYLNGVLVQDNVEIPKAYTTAAPIHDEHGKGPLYLQNHGSEVRYRNIWIVELDNPKSGLLKTIIKKALKK